MEFVRLYEDSSFENEMINIDDLSKIIDDDSSYEYFYFLSHLRHNLFNWYPFKEDGSLLEIGSSYGQLTSLLTQKVNRVVAIEDNESKAKIISNRAKEADVVVCDFSELDIDEKFDYIILCNVFEYAISFQNSKNPYVDYLKYLKTFLKDDGVILIALSNRLGLKYFAGFKEEHTNQFFTGVNGYANINNVTTFTKYELIDIIKAAEFSNYKFFYPYPSHEFPYIINTDKFVNSIPFSKQEEYFDERVDFFSEDKLNQILAKDNLAGYFSNSFLVEIRNSDKNYDSDGIDWVKLDLDRKEEFRFITIISNNNVSKFNVLKNNAEYFKILNKNLSYIFGRIKYYNCVINEYSVNYKLLNEKSVEDLLIQSIFNNDKTEFFRIIAEFYEALFYNSFKSKDYLTDEFKSIFKTKSNKSFHFHTKSNLDITFNNIYLLNNNFFTTGYEWFYDFPIPLEYIFYRVINYHIQNNILFKEFISVKEIFNFFNLDVSDIVLFSNWEEEFRKCVYEKVNKPKGIIIPKENIDYTDKFDKYLEVTYDFDNFNSNKSDKLKRDIVLNQRKVINQKNTEINNKNKLIKQKNNLIKKRNKEIKKIKKEYVMLLNSTSWKITKPFRKLLRIFK